MNVFAAAESQVIAIADHSQVGEARRLAAELAADLGLPEIERSNLAIIVTELATNLVQHAREGRLILQAYRSDDAEWAEVIAVDKGPGMADVTRCLQDGFSTAGTAGQGLGAVVRLASFFDIYSLPNVGTAVLAHVVNRSGGQRQPPPPPSPIALGVVNVPKPGERYSGDGWVASLQPDRCLFAVVDGLGHGPLASEAAIEGRRIFLENVSRDILDILDLAHGALRKTRGAAMAITEVRWDQRLVRFTGVGNISAQIWSAGSTRSMVSHSGIVGHEIRKLQDFSYPFPSGALLMMYSDGLTTHCGFDGFPGLAARHPSLVAAMLHRDCTRGRDDATILLAREP